MGWEVLDLEELVGEGVLMCHHGIGEMKLQPILAKHMTLSGQIHGLAVDLSLFLALQQTAKSKEEVPHRKRGSQP